MKKAFKYRIMRRETFLTEGSDGAYVKLHTWVRSGRLLREAPDFRRGESSLNKTTVVML